MPRPATEELTPLGRPSPSSRPFVLAFALILAGAWLIASAGEKPASLAPSREHGHTARIELGKASPAPFRPLRHQLIEAVRLGDRVHAELPATAAGSADDGAMAGVLPGSEPSLDDEEVDPATWRRIDLVMTDAGGIVTEIALLRPAWWAESHEAHLGGSIEMSMPEMGAVGEARVVSVGPCPEVRRGKGRVVTGTFTHDGSVVDIRLEGLDGAIGVTPRHPFYSADRGRFVDAGSLIAGERLLRPGGDLARVASIGERVGTARVYNIEVHGTHVYYVSLNSVLVHNQCPTGNPSTPAPNNAAPRNGQFADNPKLQDHFNRHGGDFGAGSAAQYEQQANTFLNGSRGTGVLEKARPNGDTVRYNPATEEFGIVKPDGTIRTYYKPDPAMHGRPTNLDYFNAQ